MRVLIVGAGIAGLTAALAFHRRGIDCELVDARRAQAFRQLAAHY